MDILDKYRIRFEIKPDFFENFEDFKEKVTRGEIFQRLPEKEINKALKKRWDEYIGSQKKIEKPEFIGDKPKGNKGKRKNPDWL